MKTPEQREADSIDLELDRVIRRVESLWKKYPEQSLERDYAYTGLHHLREARPHLRNLMAEEDRKATS